MIHLGLVGLGGIMRGVHIPGIQASPDLDIVAVCDIDPAVLKTVGDQLHIPTERRFADYRDLIACSDVQAVDIATPNDVHVPVALSAVRAGKSYDCEKPLALCKEDAALLAEETRKAGVKSMICFSYRYKAAARFARDIVRRGELGEIYHVSIQYLQAWGLPAAQCTRVWRFDKSRTGTGALGDLGSHAADLVTFVTGLTYDTVVAQWDTFTHERPLPDGSGMGKVDVDDYANYMARLSNGASCAFQITRFAYGRGNYQRMEIYGSKGALVYTLDEDGTNEDTVSICEGEAMRQTNTFHKLVIPAKYTVSQMQSFADILLDKPDGLSASVEDGAYNMRVMDSVEDSAGEERWVRV